MPKKYDRKTGEIIEDNQYKSSYLNILYNNVFGRILLKIIVLPFFSKCIGTYYDSKRSTKKIEKFILENNIDMSLYEKEDYKSFNDFFTRRKIFGEEFKQNIDNLDLLIAPADSKLFVYRFNTDFEAIIKDSNYNIYELTGMKEENLEEFKNGNILIFRLSVNDCHRYCFIDNGKIINKKEIKGKLHTVSSISSKYKIYKENHRVVSIMKNDTLGKTIYIEVGALLVGKIVNHDIEVYKKGDEKGFFKFGGSTIIVITKDNVKIDEDIIENSKRGIETQVSIGEKIGVIKGNNKE